LVSQEKKHNPVPVSCRDRKQKKEKETSPAERTVSSICRHQEKLGRKGKKKEKPYPGQPRNFLYPSTNRSVERGEQEGTPVSYSAKGRQCLSWGAGGSWGGHRKKRGGPNSLRSPPKGEKMKPESTESAQGLLKKKRKGTSRPRSS